MGAKRKSGKRTKSGRLSRAYKDPEVRDHGTTEVRAKRKALVGQDGDPMLAASVPGILFAHGYLDREQFDEALEYRRLRCLLYGPPWAREIVGVAIPEGRIIELQHRFDEKVFGLTEEQKRIITDVTVFDVIPNWFFSLRLGLKMLAEDELERSMLISGINSMIGRRDLETVPYWRTLGARRRVQITEREDIFGSGSV